MCTDTWPERSLKKRVTPAVASFRKSGAVFGGLSRRAGRQRPNGGWGRGATGEPWSRLVQPPTSQFGVRTCVNHKPTTSRRLWEGGASIRSSGLNDMMIVLQQLLESAHRHWLLGPPKEKKKVLTCKLVIVTLIECGVDSSRSYLYIGQQLSS